MVKMLLVFQLIFGLLMQQIVLLFGDYDGLMVWLKVEQQQWFSVFLCLFSNRCGWCRLVVLMLVRNRLKWLVFVVDIQVSCLLLGDSCGFMFIVFWLVRCCLWLLVSFSCYSFSVLLLQWVNIMLWLLCEVLGWQLQVVLGWVSLVVLLLLMCWCYSELFMLQMSVLLFGRKLVEDGLVVSCGRYSLCQQQLCGRLICLSMGLCVVCVDVVLNIMIRKVVRMGVVFVRCFMFRFW